MNNSNEYFVDIKDFDREIIEIYDDGRKIAYCDINNEYNFKADLIVERK